MIRVLIVDDSAVVRKVLSEQLSQYQDIEVVGTAIDPYVAREKIVRIRPDVVTLDLEMPRMDGLTFLAKLMKHFPLPIVIVSSLTPRNSKLALEALQLGAVEVISKPSSQYSTPDSARLVRAIRAAASARIVKSQLGTQPVECLKIPSVSKLDTTHKILTIGASTGGTTAIENVLRVLPPTTPGTLIVQHMPEDFTGPFAARLDDVCPMQVREARDGDSLAPGIVLVAPGGRHLLLKCSGARYFVRVQDGPRVGYQRPSVDVLFYSVARNAAQNAVGVLLTGMGADGAKGLLAMRESGAQTLAQDEKSCVVFGMPKEAIKLGAAQQVVSLQEMARAILRSLGSQQKAVAS